MRLLTLPAAQHLFRAVMAISPANPSVSLARARRAAGRVAAEVGATPWLESLRDVDPLALFSAWPMFSPAPADRLTRLAIRSFRPLLPGPVVDGELVPDSVEGALAAGVGADKALYLGATAHEFNEAALPFGPLLLRTPAVAALERAGLSAPLAARVAEGAGTSTAWALGQVITDATFRCQVARWAAARADANAPTWVYDFRWESRSPTVHGAAHCVDVPFGFDCLGAEGVEAATGESPPQALADAVHGDWRAVVDGSGVDARDHRENFATVVYGDDGSRTVADGGYELERELATHLAR
jgi:para-nitrobenzyl esterase